MNQPNKTNTPPLSEEQKFAIALLAGVPFTSTCQHGELVMTTKPCAVVFVNGQWNVFWKGNR